MAPAYIGKRGFFHYLLEDADVPQILEFYRTGCSASDAVYDRLAVYKVLPEYSGQDIRCSFVFHSSACIDTDAALSE